MKIIEREACTTRIVAYCLYMTGVKDTSYENAKMRVTQMAKSHRMKIDDLTQANVDLLITEF